MGTRCPGPHLLHAFEEKSIYSYTPRISALLEAPIGLCDCVIGLIFLRDCVKTILFLRDCVKRLACVMRENVEKCA